METTCAILCTNISSGLKRLALGVDITTLSLDPLDFTEPDGYVAPVVDFTCSQGKMWRNPYNEQLYQVPDQIASIVSVPGGWLNVVTKIYRKYSDVKREMSFSVGVSYMFGLFSSSTTYKIMNRAITNKSMEISDVFSFVSTSEAVFEPAFVLGLNSNAQSLLNRLPELFSDSPQDYFDFISIFGTHYFTKGKFGGYIRQIFETRSDYYATHTSSDIQVQARGIFFNLLKTKGGYSGPTFEVDAEFTKNSNSYVMYYGGDTNLLQEDGLLEWQPTVQGNPWIFGGSLVPIYEMINNSLKRDSMEQALQAHLDKAFLGELDSLLKSVQYKSKGKSLQAQVDEQAQKMVPDHDTITALGDAVDDILGNPPSWWQSIEFCYHSYSAYRAHHDCTNSQNPTCAPLGAYTPITYDNTRGKGCNIRWQLKTPNLGDSWFNEVQICFKYRPSPGADSNQCNKGRSRTELCAPVNSYTPLYFDDTDDTLGGCMMAWQLRVPPDSPNWLLHAKLCLKWDYRAGYPVTGECGVGSNNTICAFANDWTAEYFDNTDSRAGVCSMQWSIQG